VEWVLLISWFWLVLRVSCVSQLAARHTLMRCGLASLPLILGLSFIWLQWHTTMGVM